MNWAEGGGRRRRVPWIFIYWEDLIKDLEKNVQSLDFTAEYGGQSDRHRDRQKDRQIPRQIDGQIYAMNKIALRRDKIY